MSIVISSNHAAWWFTGTCFSHENLSIVQTQKIKKHHKIIYVSLFKLPTCVGMELLYMQGTAPPKKLCVRHMQLTYNIASLII
jgi:hypothetical protein